MIATDHTAEKKPRSTGEKAFDWAVYGGLAGLGTFIVTVPVADWITHGGGKQYHQSISRWVTNKGLGFLPAKSRAGVATELVKTTALMMGGNLMLAPIWGAEQLHVPFATTMNRLTGDPTPPEAIAEKPKQTARSLIEGRLAAFAAVFAGLYTAGKFFGPQMEAFENAMGRAVAGFMNQPAKETSRAFRYGKIGALDIFATASAAGLLYAASRFFAKNRNQQTHKKDTAIPSMLPERQHTETQQNEPSVAHSLPSQQVEGATHDGIIAPHVLEAVYAKS